MRKRRVGFVTLNKAPGSKAPFKWRCSWPTAEGKYPVRYFKLKKEAEDFRDERNAELEDSGHAGHVSDEERSAVIELREELAAAGLTVRDALADAIERQGRLSRSVTVTQLCAKAIACREKEKLSADYIKDLRSRLGRFEISFGHRPVADIHRAEIDEWINALGLAPTTLANFRRVLVVLFNDAIEWDYIIDNPAEPKRKRKRKTEGGAAKKNRKPPGILTPGETATLLSVADDRLVPELVLGAFCGVRQAEIGRLDWSAVNLGKGRLVIPDDVSKTGMRRLVEIPENAVAWLVPYAAKAGLIRPTNARRLMDAVKDASGFRGRRPKDKDALALWKKRRPWPGNALRHSFASYHLAEHQDAGKTSHQLGHRGNPAMLHEHYDAVAEPEDAAEFWKIRPAGETAGNVIAMG